MAACKNCGKRAGGFAFCKKCQKQINDMVARAKEWVA